MPITFNCPCGKALRVSDESAGKRVKCPACNAIGAVPKAEPMFEVIEDEPEERLAPPPAPTKAKPVAKPTAKPAAKPAPDEVDDEKPKPKKKPTRADDDDEDEPKKKPAFSKGSRRDEDDEEEEERPKKKKKKRRDDDDDDEEPRQRRRKSADPDAGKKIMYLIGGLVLAVVGIGIAVFWWQNGPHTGRRPYSGYIFGACMVVVGIGTAIKGITGNFDDE